MYSLISYVTVLADRMLTTGEIADLEQFSKQAHEIKTHIDEYKFRNILKLLAEGKKIEAIKEYRTVFGVWLKEAKDAIEGL